MFGWFRLPECVWKFDFTRVVQSQRSNCLQLHNIVLLTLIVTKPWSSTNFARWGIPAPKCQQPAYVSSTCRHSLVHQDQELSSKCLRTQPWQQLCEKRKKCKKRNIHMPHRLHLFEPKTHTLSKSFSSLPKGSSRLIAHISSPRKPKVIPSTVMQCANKLLLSPTKTNGTTNT